MGRPRKAHTPPSALLEAAQIAPKVAKVKSGQAVDIAPEQASPEANAPKVGSVELRAPSPGNSATHKPDLLAHPYHEHLDARGLEGFYAAPENIDFHRSRGFTVFERPAGTKDEHVIFHGTDGSLVRRGGMVLMTRPKSQGAQERKANADAYNAEAQELLDEAVHQKAPASQSKAEGYVRVVPAQATAEPLAALPEE